MLIWPLNVLLVSYMQHSWARISILHSACDMPLSHPQSICSILELASVACGTVIAVCGNWNLQVAWSWCSWNLEFIRKHAHAVSSNIKPESISVHHLPVGKCHVVDTCITLGNIRWQLFFKFDTGLLGIGFLDVIIVHFCIEMYWIP